MTTDIKTTMKESLLTLLTGSEEDQKKYREYVQACHSEPGVFVTEYSFKEWIDAGKPISK